MLPLLQSGVKLEGGDNASLAQIKAQLRFECFTAFLPDMTKSYHLLLSDCNLGSDDFCVPFLMCNYWSGSARSVDLDDYAQDH